MPESLTLYEVRNGIDVLTLNNPRDGAMRCRLR